MTAALGTTDRWLDEELSWIGTVENPAGSNKTDIGVRFGWNGVAWCCEDQSVVLLDTFGRKILWTAGVADAIERARRGDNGLQLLGSSAIVQVGDLPTYDYGGHGNPADFHIEGVVNPGTQTKFETVGGNVRDACRRQWRDRRYVTHFIRPPFAAGSTGLGSPPEEDDFMAHLTDQQQDALVMQVAQTQQRMDALEKMSEATNAAVGRLEVAIGDPTNGLYVKFNALEAKVDAILKKLA